MIYCANNNTLYESAADVCRDLGIDKSSVSRVLSGQRKAAGAYLLAELDDLSEDGIRAARAWMLYSIYKIVLDAPAAPRKYAAGGD